MKLCAGLDMLIGVTGKAAVCRQYSDSSLVKE